MDVHYRIRRGERGYGLGFIVDLNVLVCAVLWLTVDHEAAAPHVQDPVFGNLGAGVEGGLGAEVEGEGGVGDFGDEVDVGGFGAWGEFVIRLSEDDRVGLRITRWVVFGANIDGNLLANSEVGKDRPQPLAKQHEGPNVRMVLAHFLD